ncbi:MAG: MATE family efflux transporter [Nevskia sp.]
MHDLTKGPVLKLLLGMTAFMLIAISVQTLYSLVDLYWVGTLGPQAVAAVTVASSVMFVSLALSQMFGVGTGALVAQAIGAKDPATAHEVFNQAMSLSLLVTALFAVLAWAGEDAFSRAFSSDAGTAALARDYLGWFVPAMALQCPLAAMGSALRGSGNMKPGTIASVGSVLLNMALAPVLIFGWLGAPRLGVAGAGLATLISVVVALLGLWLYFQRPQSYLKLRISEWRPRPAMWGRLLKIGLPSALEFLLMACYMTFITAMLRPYGATEQAAFGIGQRLLQAGMLPVMALSFAAAALVGQNYGAKLGERVRETFAATLKLSIGAMLLLVLLAELVPGALIGGFTDDPAVLAAGTTFLRVIALNLLATGVAFSCFGVLSGLGNTIPTLISSATRIGLVVLGALLLVKLGSFQVTWLWWLSVSATVVQMFMNLGFLQRELRRKLGPAANADLAVQQV